jgi:hypothetical protein
MRKKVLSLMFLLMSSAFAFTQTSFTNHGTTGACVNPNYPTTYYCTSMPRIEGGVQVGYLAFWLKLNSDGVTFQNGSLWLQDMTGTSFLSSTNFAGTFDGKTINGSFSASNGSGSTSQSIGPVYVCAGRYGCSWKTGDLGGSGTYTLQ